MADRSPLLSDEDAYDTVIGSAFADAGIFRDHLDSQYERDHDPEARFLRENGVDEETLDAAERNEADTARELGRDEIEARYGPSQQSSTARLMEEAELYRARPLPSETDTRHVWINGDEPISFDGPLPANLQAAFDQIGEGFDLIVDAVAPEGYRMADEREDLCWGLVNLFHAQIARMDKRIGELGQRAESLRKTEARRIGEDGRDAASLELEGTTDTLRAQAEKRDRYENFRDYAADLYLHHTARVWEPRRGSNVSQTRGTAQRIDGKEYIRARQAGHDTREIPEGTLIAVAGGKTGPDRDAIYKALDLELQKHPDMILAHGGARDGVHKIASTWARNRGVPEMPFVPEWGEHKSPGAAIVQRDIAMVRAGPAAVLHFTGPGLKAPRICEEAEKRGIEVRSIADPPAHRQGAARTGDRSHAVPASTRAPVFAGVGARATPAETLSTITAMSEWLGKRGWQLRSGGAKGADDAFAQGADASARTVVLPWEGYNGRQGAECVVPSGEIAERARKIAASLHPAWDKCDDTARSLHARNAAIVLGPDLDSPADALVCWTEDGKTVGGTGMAIRMAEKYGVPVFNLATLHPREICQAMTALEEQAAMRRDNSAAAGAGLAEADAAYTVPAVHTDHARKPTAAEQARADAFLASARQTFAASAPEAYDALVDHALEALTDSFNDHDVTHDLGIGDVAHGAGDVYHGGDKIGMIERVIVPHEGYPLNAHLLQLDRDPGHVYVIPPGKDPAAETQAILDRPAISAATRLSAGRDEDHARKAEPHEQAIADAFLGAAGRAAEPASRPDLPPAQAFEALVESILPEDNRLSEDAARSHGDQTHPLRKTLMERIIGAVESVASGPDGAEEQLSDLRLEAVELGHKDTGSEIDLNQQRDHSDKSRYTADGLATLHTAQDELKTVYEHETGERWSPRPAAQMDDTPAVSAAAAEALQVLERIDRNRDLARLPKGFPVAVSAFGDEADRETVRAKLDQMREHRPDMWIAHANSSGTLEHVAEWATDNNVKQVTFELRKGDAGAAAIRQRDHQLIDTVRPGGVIEFTAEGARKTFLVNKANDDDIPVWQIDMTEERARRQQDQDRARDRAQSENIRETLSVGAGQGRSW